MEKKQTLKQIFLRVLCSLTATAMIFSSFCGLTNVAAADVPLEHSNAVTVSKPKYEETQSYVAGNLDQKLTKDVKGKSEKKIKKELEQTKYSIRLKRLIAEKSKLPKECTIDTLWSKYANAFVSQYTEVVPLYTTSDNSEYYIADFSAQNGIGDIYDAAFVRGTDNKNPDIRRDIKFDKESGLAYIPKSYFTEQKDTLLTGQVMYAGSVSNQDTKIDVTVKNPNTDSKEDHKILTGNTYDVTTSVPITDSLKIARGLSLEDLKVYLNDSETEYDLKEKEAAVYNKDTGELELGVSPATLKSVRVEIKKDKLSERILKLFTTDVSAKITDPDKLKFAADKKTGDPIVLDKIDTSKLQDGQVFEYNANIQYFSDIDDVTGDYSTKARKESIKHSIKYLYIPTGSAESGWFDVYDKGSDFDDTDGVNQKTNFEDVTFGMTLPSKNQSNYKATAINKNKATLNFHQKGTFTKTYDEDDASYSSKHMYAGECCHITNPMGTQSGDTAKIRLSVLHVNTDDGYVIIGLNTQEVNTQSGFGIYKLAIESKGALQIKKSSANSTITNGNNCYSLKGAEFGVYSDAACTKKVMTLTTKADGTTDAKEIDAGKYYVKETKAPKGYKLNTSVKSVTIDTNNDEENPAIVEIADTPGTDPATLEVKKVDKETGTLGQQGNASLAGAQFTVNYYSDYYSDISKLPNNPTRSWVLETKEKSIGGKKFTVIGFEDQYKVSGDEFYKKADGSVTIPLGTITISETKAPEGYKIEDSTVSVNGATLSDRTYFTKVEEGKDLGTVAAGFTVSDPVKKYGIQVYKFDEELNKSEAIGGKNHTASPEGATLEGTTFSIINRSTNSIHYKDKEIKPGEEVTKIKASWDKTLKKYTAQTGNKDLPYGTYGVKEIASSTGYKMSDGSEKTVVCHGEDGHLYTPNDSGDLNIKNEVIRGDVEFIKREGRKQQNISAAFKITNSTTGESHVVVTDKNGNFTSDDPKHSAETNANDKLLNGYNEDAVLKTSDFNYNSGVWFGLGEDQSMAKTDDTKGALPYGKYTLEELRCETNKNLDLVTVDFWIQKNQKSVDLGTIIDNETTTPKIHTTAKDDTTGTHVCAAGEDASITDTVTHENLDDGEEYTLKGILMDKTTGTAVLTKDGKEITAQKTFKAKGANNTVEMSFSFDATDLAGKDVVVFETLYKGGTDSSIVVATHKDIEDEGQTIKFPAIKTKAVDAETGTNETKADEDVTIVDTVSYRNLIVGKTYTVIGTLMDKETGKAAKDDSGDVITASAKFTAEKADGTVDVTFKFSGVNTAGKTLVAFEELIYQKKTFAVHTDINDEAQTIYVPNVKTTATDKENGSHTSLAGEQVTIIDEVAYTNLTAGKEYTVKGTLMDQSTGEELLINGKPVTAEKTFTPEAADGTVELEFTLDASALAGKTTVVFEDIAKDGISVATHADIKDEEQTIHFPSVKTTATDKADGDHSISANGKVTIVDQVEWKNVKVGQKIKISGKLMDKSTGKALKVNGEEVTAEQIFTAEAESGTTNLAFTFDASDLAGKDLVVFEKLIDVESNMEIGRHEDINDKGQTVNVKKPVTPKKTTPSHGSGNDVAKTGQSSAVPIVIVGIVAAFGVAGSAFTLKKKKKKQ
ncbi:VaFE repeat-containing surface-anchored protein [Anaerostipes hominis (ex Lee et al. 2021)]|uniref:VaFE repeat-containing surface-anchored protein n=1 Tax=Anaerostipes hominis (ex Lee et al. 2021) TaxID=2025494 RepID=A0ABV4DK56_9FIRM